MVAMRLWTRPFIVCVFKETGSGSVSIRLFFFWANVKNLFYAKKVQDVNYPRWKIINYQNSRHVGHNIRVPFGCVPFYK